MDYGIVFKNQEKNNIVFSNKIDSVCIVYYSFI